MAVYDARPRQMRQYCYTKRPQCEVAKKEVQRSHPNLHLTCYKDWLTGWCVSVKPPKGGWRVR